MAQALAKLGIEHYQWAEVRLITCIDKGRSQILSATPDQFGKVLQYVIS